MLRRDQSGRCLLTGQTASGIEALAHVIGDKAEQAYRRSDALARRRELMDAWARHCEGAAGENVFAFKQPA